MQQMRGGKSHGGPGRLARPWTLGLLLAIGTGPATAAEGCALGVGGEAPVYLDYLSKLACGTGGGVAETCRKRLQAPDCAGARLRQLAGHFLVTAFAELGAARLEEEDSRGNLAPYILERARVAEVELHEACTAAARPDAAGAVAYPLERADALVAVAEAIEAGTKPTRRRLLSLVMNPQRALEKTADVFRDALTDKLYSDAYQQSFLAAQALVTANDKFDMKAWSEAWRAMDERLNAQCRTLARLTGARVSEDDNLCEVKRRCAALKPPGSN